MGSIPDGVIGIFHLHNTSGRTMVLGLTQSVTKIDIRNTSCGKGKNRPGFRADNLTTFMFCREIWEGQTPRIIGTCSACNGIVYVWFYIFYIYIPIIMLSLGQIVYRY